MARLNVASNEPVGRHKGPWWPSRYNCIDLACPTDSLKQNSRVRIQSVCCCCDDQVSADKVHNQCASEAILSLTNVDFDGKKSGMWISLLLIVKMIHYYWESLFSWEMVTRNMIFVFKFVLLLEGFCIILDLSFLQGLFLRAFLQQQVTSLCQILTVVRRK